MVMERAKRLMEMKQDGASTSQYHTAAQCNNLQPEGDESCRAEWGEGTD
jgi:hypothetical protein